MAMINRGRNHITVSWKNVETLRGSCVLEMLDETKQWRVVYWGDKNEVKVGGLAPCTCYDFRVKTDGNCLEIKGATTDEGFWTLHMTRAVKVGKMALLRKIAHSKPILLEVENRNMKTPLRQAVEKNDLQLVTLLVTLGANVNTVAFYTKRSLLMVAISLGHLAIAGFLVDKGCNVGSVDINGLNVLHHAVDSNNVDNVKFALKLVDVDVQDCCGWTPLLRAAILNCSLDIIEILIENGASISTKDKNGLDFNKHRLLASSL